MPKVARLASERVSTRALVLRRTPTGDADLLVTAFTLDLGVMTLSARSARRATSKLGPLEPVQTLRVTVDVHSGRDIGKLVDSRVERPRVKLLSDAARLDAAFKLLLWTRAVMAPHQVEPVVFTEVDAALDDLECGLDVSSVLGGVGLSMLGSLGYALELSACVVCDRACGPSSPAFARARLGGLVCRSCGGGDPGDVLLSAELRRAALARLQDRGVALPNAETLVELVDAAFAAHATHARGVGSK
jgi:DNA repair protein RecO (recombination protein O)